MALQRFFLSPEQFNSENINVQGELAHQLQRVLRLPIGEKVLLLDGTGLEYQAVITGFAKSSVSFQILEKDLAQGEPTINLTLYQALLKGEKFDFVLQKNTEIGISRIVPVLMERCVSDSASPAKLERWRKIVREAAEQSRRGILPSLSEVLSLKQAINSDTAELKLIAWESATVSLKQRLSASPQPNTISLVIGAEGGISPSEVELAQGQGFLPVSLGSRILRAETAALVTISQILYHYDSP
jgi:16S rRNA (uracil1498-N3)-methyltransferase